VLGRKGKNRELGKASLPPKPVDPFWSLPLLLKTRRGIAILKKETVLGNDEKVIMSEWGNPRKH